MITGMFLRPLEMLLNRGLTQSATAQSLAAGLEGRVLGLTVDGTPFDVRIGIVDGRFAVTPGGSVPEPDALIGGGPLALGRLLRRDPGLAVRGGDVRLTGDTEIAERFRELLHCATPDLEQELARLVGDPVAHEVGSAARAFGDWSRSAGDSVARGVAQYLQERSAVLPTPAEIASFARRVDEIVNDVERAEARIRRLADHLRNAQ